MAGSSPNPDLQHPPLRQVPFLFSFLLSLKKEATGQGFMDFLGFSKERKEKRDVDQKGTSFP